MSKAGRKGVLPPGIDAPEGSGIEYVWRRGCFSCTMNSQQPPVLGVGFSFGGNTEPYPSQLIPTGDRYAGWPHIDPCKWEPGYGVAIAHLLTIMAVARHFGREISLYVEQRHPERRVYGKAQLKDGKSSRIYARQIIPFELAWYKLLAETWELECKAQNYDRMHWLTLTATPQQSFDPEQWLQFNR